MITRRYCGYCGADLGAADNGAFRGRCGAPRDCAAWTLTEPAGAPPRMPGILYHAWRLAVTTAGATTTRQVIVATTLLITTTVVLGTAYHLLLGCAPLLLIALALHLWLSHQQAPRPGRGDWPARSAGANEKARTHER